MAKVIIFGTGKGADIAYRYLTADSDHEICGFTVQKQFIAAQEFRGQPVVDFESVQKRFPPSHFKMFIPLGFQNMNRLRASIYAAAKEKGYVLISYVHSSVKTIEELRIGENCFILENQSINLDVTIGNDVTMWSGNHIGDRSVIGDHVWLTSKVCIGGDVRVEPFCFLGMSATISNKLTVAEGTFVGANALISKGTEKNGVYVVAGTPCAALPSDKFLKIANID